MIRACGACIALIALAFVKQVDGLPAPTFKERVRVARRVGRFSSLTGAWSGEYQYPPPARGRVPFNARIDEAGGSFTGDIDEPNTFADPSAPRLFATIAGTRNGSAVSFTKTMDGTGGVNHSILYEGLVNSDFTRIEGTWTIPGVWSGSFFMEREGAAVEEAASRAEGASAS